REALAHQIDGAPARAMMMSAKARWMSGLDHAGCCPHADKLVVRMAAVAGRHRLTPSLTGTERRSPIPRWADEQPCPRRSASISPDGPVPGVRHGARFLACPGP